MKDFEEYLKNERGRGLSYEESMLMRAYARYTNLMANNAIREYNKEASAPITEQARNVGSYYEEVKDSQPSDNEVVWRDDYGDIVENKTGWDGCHSCKYADSPISQDPCQHCTLEGQHYKPLN